MTPQALHKHKCTCGHVATSNLRVAGYNQSSQHVHNLALLKKYDPTRTTSLRNAFAAQMGKRFRVLRGLIRKAIVDEDCFGLINPRNMQETPGRRAFAFGLSGDKVEGFMDWLREQAGMTILEKRQLGSGVRNAWTNTYVQSAYQQGIKRSRDELIQAGYDVATIEETGGLDVAFNQPFHTDRVGLAYSRTYNELRNVTNTMDGQISRVLAQGMADGKHPREIAKLLTRTISGPTGGLGLTDTLGRFIPAERRARIIARTETIRAHHSAMVQEYRNWGLAGVTVIAEWSTAGDGRVCAVCRELEGQQFGIDEIEGMIPRHPQCRCISIPVDRSEVQ